MTQGRNDSALTIICEPGLCSVSRSTNFYKTKYRMMVLLLCSVSRSINFHKTSHCMMVLRLAGGVRTKKDKQPRNFYLNVSVVYTLLVRRYTDAIKLKNCAFGFCFKCFSF